MDSILDLSLSSQSCGSSVLSTPSPVRGNSLSPQGVTVPRSTFEDLLGDTVGQDKQQLHEALIQLLKGNPQILEAVQKESQTSSTSAAEVDGPNLNVQFPHGSIERQSTRTISEGSRKPKERMFPELNNRLNQPCIRGTISSTDSDEDAFNTPCSAAKQMSSRELHHWRKKLFSVFVGHLPLDLRKRELIQLFSEVGNIQDIHLQPAEDSRSFTYGFVRYCTLAEATNAVSELNGKVLGNRAIAVEIASETREKLVAGSEVGPLSARDKLLGREFPRGGNYRPMSGDEAEEKLIEWKLRQLTADPKMSHAVFVKNYMNNFTKDDGQDELMERLEKIVKKLAHVPSETLANASGDEGHTISQRILNDCQSVLGTSESPDRLPSSMLRDGHSVSQEQRPALVSPDQLPSSMLRDGHSVSQEQRPALVSPDRLPSSVLHPVSQEQIPALVSPDQLPSSVLRHGNPVSQEQIAVPVSPDRLPPVSQNREIRVPEKRSLLGSPPCCAESGIQRNTACAKEVGRSFGKPLGGQSAGVEPRHGSASTAQGLCDRMNTSPRGPYPTNQGIREPPFQLSARPCVPTHYGSGEFPQQVLPFVDQSQAPFCNPVSYSPHQTLTDLQNQIYFTGIGRGRLFPQRFQTPPPIPEFNVLHFGNPGAPHTWPRDVVRLQPSRFRHIHNPCNMSLPGEMPVSRFPLSTATAARRFPADPQRRGNGDRVLVSEFGSPVAASDWISSPQRGVSVRGGQKTVDEGVMSEEVKTASSHSMNTLDDFDCPFVREGIASATETSKQTHIAEAQGSVTAWNGQNEEERTGLMKDGQEVQSQSDVLLNEMGSPTAVQGQSLERNESTREVHGTIGATAVNTSSNDEGSNGKGRTKSTENHENQRTECYSGIQSSEDDAAVCGLGKRETSLLQLKVELERILAENKMLRTELGEQKQLSRKVCGMYSNEAINALEEEIHVKEIQLQREKEIISARYSEQELLYEREKLEVAFDMTMAKELETERAIGDTRNSLTMAKFEQDLLLLYRKLMSLS